MSAISCSAFEAEGIYITRFEQRLATGEAAQNLGAEVGADNLEDPVFAMTCFDTTRDRTPSGGQEQSQ